MSKFKRPKHPTIAQMTFALEMFNDNGGLSVPPDRFYPHQGELIEIVNGIAKAASDYRAQCRKIAGVE